MEPPTFSFVEGVSEGDDSDGEHPLVKMLEDEGEWLSGLWPLLLMLFDVRMTHPGAPEESDMPDSGDFSSHHQDFIP